MNERRRDDLIKSVRKMTGGDQGSSSHKKIASDYKDGIKSGSGRKSVPSSK